MSSDTNTTSSSHSNNARRTSATDTPVTILAARLFAPSVTSSLIDSPTGIPTETFPIPALLDKPLTSYTALLHEIRPWCWQAERHATYAGREEAYAVRLWIPIFSARKIRELHSVNVASESAYRVPKSIDKAAPPPSCRNANASCKVAIKSSMPPLRGGADRNLAGIDVRLLPTQQWRFYYRC